MNRTGLPHRGENRTIDFNNKDDNAMHDRLVELVERMLVLNKGLKREEDKGFKPLV